MPFSFLHPWFWLGALAVAAPVWLHLRWKKETNLIRFSAVRFLEDESEPQRSPLRLEDWVLFVIRLLALLLLIAGFAWPYLRHANSLPIRESRVYVLDNTLSHQANDGFNVDRARILADVQSAGSDVQVAVVELSNTPRVVVAFGEDRDTAREKIKALQPSFERGSYLAAFRQASALLGNSLGEQKRIVFCGDNQENQWKENVNTPPFLRDVRIDLPPAASKTLPNLWLSEPRTQRIFLGDRSLVNFTVKLSHTGPAPTANIVVRANSQAVLSRTIDLEKQPETIVIQAQWEADPSAWVRGEAVLEGTPDALPADDHVFFSLAPVVEGRVALLAQSPYLRLALSPEIMRGQWATRIIDPARLDDEVATNQDADVLCLESNYLQSSAARKLLSRYLTNQRGVFLVINRLTPAIEGCLRELGFEPEGTWNTGANNPDKFQFVFSNHPIFHPFLSPDYGNLMDIKVLEYVRLKSASALPLVFSESGAGLFFQGTRPSAKLFVAAFGLDRDHTSWPVDQTFIPFLDLTLQAARAEDPTPASFEPGELGTIELPASVKTREVVLREGDHEMSRAPVQRGKAQLRMPDKPGLYALSSDTQQTLKILSVNPSPKESQLVYLPAAEPVKAWQQNTPVLTEKPAMATVAGQVRLSSILHQRLWWWMVFGALIMLLLEMGWAEVRKEGR
ncbi:MAG TPA: BatA and WFA domain-containing protein [Candidatus Limnocylindrales bacterium]|nr:BatA and WFA domain-containing protein [Candidatus Limnocylindrales bacterium]